MMIHSKLFSLFPYNYLGNVNTMEDEESSEDLEVLMIKSDHPNSKKKKKRKHSKYDEESDSRKKRKKENQINNKKDSSEIIELFSSVKRKGKRKKDKKKRSKSYSDSEQMHIKKENNKYNRSEEIIVNDDSDIEITRTSKKHSSTKYIVRDSDIDSDCDNYRISDSDVEIENVYEIPKVEKKYRIPSSREQSAFCPREKSHKSSCRKDLEKSRDENKARSKSSYKGDDRERRRHEKKKRSRDEDKKESPKYCHKKYDEERHRYENAKESSNYKNDDFRSHYEKDIREILKHRNKERSKDGDSKDKSKYGDKNYKRDDSRYDNKRNRDENKDRSKSRAKKEDGDRPRIDNNRISSINDKRERSKAENKHNEREKDKKERYSDNHKKSDRRKVGYDKEKCDPEKNSKGHRENQPSNEYPSRSESLTHVNIVKNAFKSIGSNSKERLITTSKNINAKSRQNECHISEVHKQKDSKIVSSKSSSKSTEMEQRLKIDNNIISDNQQMPSLLMRINRNAEIDLITEVRQNGILITPEIIKKEDEKADHQTDKIQNNEHNQKDCNASTCKSSSKITEKVQRLTRDNTMASDNQLMPSLIMKINRNAEIDLITEVRQPQNRKKDDSTHNQDRTEIPPLISPNHIKKEHENNHETVTLLHNNLPLPISPFLKKSNTITNDAPIKNSGNLFRIENVQGNFNINDQNVPDKNLNPIVSQMPDIPNSDLHLKQENIGSTDLQPSLVENQMPHVPYIKLEEIVNVPSKTMENQKSRLPYIKIEEIITQNEIHSEIYDQIDSKAYVKSVINNEYLENSAPESKYILHKDLGLDKSDTVNISIINTHENLSQTERTALTNVPDNECLYNSGSESNNGCELYKTSLHQYESTTNGLPKVTKLNMLPENLTDTNHIINTRASVHPVNKNTNIEPAIDLAQPEKNTSSIIKINSFNTLQTDNNTNENIDLSVEGQVNLEYISDKNIQINNFESAQTVKEINKNIDLNSLESVQKETLRRSNTQINSLNMAQPHWEELNYNETFFNESPMLRIESVWSTATRGTADSDDTDNHYPIPEDLAEVIEDLSEIVEIGRVEVTSTSACSFRIKKENEAARNYYVTHHDIKYCPMCKRELDIDRFKFNPTTMIFTMLCICNLTIYQLLNPEKYKGCRVR